MSSHKPSRASGDLPAQRPARARATRQKRSVDRQNRIAEAAIAVIAQHGIAGVTHRLVAREAGVSLAATTYHYETKLDIIADASAQLLHGYTEAFRRFLERRAERPALSFRDFAMRVVANAAGRDRMATLAWCEIILDAARHSEARMFAGQWFGRLHEIWREIAVALGVDDPVPVARTAIDIVIGLIFVVVPLGLSEAQVEAALFDGGDPAALWAPSAPQGDVAPAAPRGGRKADETRARILDAAIAILIDEGPGAISYRAVATRAGLSAPAPIYYYPSVETLLNAAQIRLFEASKDRYRMTMASVDYSALDIERLADLTAAVFLREATEYGPVSLAGYPIWLEAARHPSLRSTLWAAIADQNEAWGRLLSRFDRPPGGIDPLLIQGLFRGKLIRILATGAELTDLADVRGSFAALLRAIVTTGDWVDL